MTCVICCENQFTPNGVPVALQCGHVLHKTCIEEWHRSSSSRACPLCGKNSAGPLLTLYVDASNKPGSSARNGNRNAKNKQRASQARYTSSEDFDELSESMSWMSVYGSDMKWMALQGNMYSLEEDLQDAHEDNKLLQDKVTDLETKLALKMSRVDMLQAEIDRMAKISLAHKTHIRSLQVNLASKKELLKEFGHYY